LFNLEINITALFFILSQRFHLVNKNITKKLFDKIFESNIDQLKFINLEIEIYKHKKKKI
jgi:hypothetical protein